MVTARSARLRRARDRHYARTMTSVQTIPDITGTPAWDALRRHHEQIGQTHLRQFFEDDPDRGRETPVDGAGERSQSCPHLRDTRQIKTRGTGTAAEEGVSHNGANRLSPPLGDPAYGDWSDIYQCPPTLLDRLRHYFLT